MSSALRLLVPSLNPNMLRGVTWLRVVDEVRPKPSWLHRTDTTPKPIRTRLRTACTATCGSLAQAWMQMSPPLRAGSRSSPTKPGQVLQRGGLAVGEAEPVVEQRRAVADGDGEVGGVEVVGLTGVLGGAVGAATDDAAGRRLGAGGHPLGGAGPGLEHVGEGGPVLGDDVERDEVHPVLGRGDDPGLALAPERDRRASSAAAPQRSRPSATVLSRHTHRRRRPRHRRRPRRRRRRAAGGGSRGGGGLGSVTWTRPLRRPWRSAR